MSKRKTRLIIKQPDEKRVFRQHFTPIGGRRRKTKIVFETKDEAWEFMESHCICNVHPYWCKFCNKIHIGHIYNEKTKR